MKLSRGQGIVLVIFGLSSQVAIFWALFSGDQVAYPSLRILSTVGAAMLGIGARAVIGDRWFYRKPTISRGPGPPTKTNRPMLITGIFLMVVGGLLPFYAAPGPCPGLCRVPLPISWTRWAGVIGGIFLVASGFMLMFHANRWAKWKPSPFTNPDATGI